MKDIIQKIERFSKHDLNQFFSKELAQKLKQQEFNLKTCYQLWEKSKALGFIDSAQLILTHMVKTSVDEKRTWMLLNLKEKLGKKNQREKDIIEKALRDYCTKHADKDLIYENIETLKVVEREIYVRNHFNRWVNSKKPPLKIEELKILYLGTLIHGVSREVAELLLKIAEKHGDVELQKKLKTEFQIKSTVQATRKSPLKKDEVVQVFDTQKMIRQEEDEVQKINLNFIDQNVLKKYINDILFSLYCLKDYKNIYKIEELIDFSFKKNPKEYQAYYFYKLTALIDQKKYKQVQSFISNEIFNLPLTQKELLPFMYLMAEALIGLKQYEDALNFYLALQKDKQFELRALMRINEIKKN